MVHISLEGKQVTELLLTNSAGQIIWGEIILFHLSFYKGRGVEEESKASTQFPYLQYSELRLIITEVIY